MSAIRSPLALPSEAGAASAHVRDHPITQALAPVSHRLKRREAMCMTHFLALLHCHDLRASGSAGSWSCGNVNMPSASAVRGRSSMSVQVGSQGQGALNRGGGVTKVVPHQARQAQQSQGGAGSFGTSKASRLCCAHQWQRLHHKGMEAGHPAAELRFLVQDGRDGHVGGGPAGGGKKESAGVQHVGGQATGTREAGTCV